MLRLIYTAQLPDKGPFVIRYPRGRGRLTDWKCPLEEIEIGKGRKLKEGKDLAVLSIGTIGNSAADAIAQVEAENPDISVAHYDLRFVKPLDGQLLEEVAARFSRIITVEDGAVTGGVGSAVLEYMSEHNHAPHVRRIGLPDHFVEHGAVGILHHICGTDSEGIAKAIREELSKDMQKTEYTDKVCVLST